MKFTEMCHQCGVKKYGEPKRDLGAITVGLWACPECNGENMKENRPVIYAQDWGLMY